MTEPHWTSYVGMATGIFGAITGISGAIMGYKSYRRSNDLKSLDLRLELRKAANEMLSDLSQLEELIAHANKSRQAVASAKGKLRSGMMVKWKQEVEADKIRIEQLSINASSAENNYDKLNHKELESKLVEVHKLQIQIDKLRNKYDAEVHADDEDRKHIREDVRARHAPKQ